MQICAPNGDVVAHGISNYDMKLIDADSPVLEAKVVINQNNLVVL